MTKQRLSPEAIQQRREAIRARWHPNEKKPAVLPDMDGLTEWMKSEEHAALAKDFFENYGENMRRIQQYRNGELTVPKGILDQLFDDELDDPKPTAEDIADAADELAPIRAYLGLDKFEERNRKLKAMRKAARRHG